MKLWLATLTRIADAVERLVIVQAALYQDRHAERQALTELSSNVAALQEAVRCHVVECTHWQHSLTQEVRRVAGGSGKGVTH